KRPYDFFDIKGVYEIIRELLAVEINITTDARPSYMEEETVSLCIGKEPVGFLGRVERTVLEEVYDIKRDVFYAEISLDGLPDKDIFEQKFVSLVRYPSVTNDISFVVDKKVSHADIYKNIIKLNIKELENVEIYDIFEGKNIPKEKKSMTYALLFRSDERTLKGEEVRERVDRILDSLKKSFHIQLRTL
ncbi:MAG: hypothetical protein JW928_07695, partial [Candidatus Aureabacteria bacterium]|nr:hypothetical protein [Candidatus Auribacterota bacterium]